MGRLTAFEEETRDLNRHLWFLWVATAIALLSLVLSLVLSRGKASLVWLAVLAVCAGGLLIARHFYVRLAHKIEDLPPGARRRAGELLMRHGRFLLIRLDDSKAVLR